MDTPKLPVKYMEEGRRYLASIEGLGLRPTALFWAFDHALKAFTLVLAAEEFDQVGPLELSRLLFKAYNASATPPEIDPLLIRLHSPNHTFMHHVAGMPIGAEIVAYDDRGDVVSGEVERRFTTGDGVEFDVRWIYRLESRPANRKTVDVLRRWHRFERNVDRFAA